MATTSSGASAPTLKETIARSHDSEAPFADFIMHCGERKWHIHRVVIAAESKFFEKVCTSDFKEAREQQVRLDDDDPDDLDLMIRFFYSSFEPVRFLDYTILEFARLYALADKYDCPRVKHQAHLGVSCRWPDVPELDEETLAGEAVEAAPYVYTHSPPGHRTLRNSLPNIFHDIGRKENGQLYVEREDWLWLMEKAPECVADILGFNFKAVDAGDDA